MLLARKIRVLVAGLVICSSFLIIGCAGESAKQAYRDTSDWLNDVPNPPKAPAWRLSPKPAQRLMPYPKLSDFPIKSGMSKNIGLKPEGASEGLEKDSEASVNSEAKGKNATKLVFGAPARARLAPLHIPARPEAN